MESSGSMIIDDFHGIGPVLGPDEAVVSVKGGDLFLAFGDHFPARVWMAATPRMKAELVVATVRKAAQHYRNPQDKYVRQEQENVAA